MYLAGMCYEVGMRLQRSIEEVQITGISWRNGLDIPVRQMELISVCTGATGVEKTGKGCLVETLNLSDAQETLQHELVAEVRVTFE